MHGCNFGSVHVVNAEVDSMGGVVDGGVGVGLKTSLHRAAIEKAQAELRQEYDAREERRKELEFLEKGGNPLDFKLGNAASVSVQSTSLADQHQEQFVTSEAKGSFVLTASPHGDSVDSRARPGAPSINEPNTADNLLLFDGENELPEGEKRSLHSYKRNKIAPSEQSSQIGGGQNAKETEESAIFTPYARRNRSRPNHGPRGGSRGVKGFLSDTNRQKDRNGPSLSKPKPASSNGETLVKDPTTNDPLDNESVGLQARQTNSVRASIAADKLDITLNRIFKEDQRIVPSQDDTVQDPLVLASGKASADGERNPGASGELELSPCVAAAQPGNESCPSQTNGFGTIKVDRKSSPAKDQNSSAAVGLKRVDPEPGCAQTSLARDVNDTDMCTNTTNTDENGNTSEQTLFNKKLSSTGYEAVKERSETNIDQGGATVKNEHGASFVNHSGCGSIIKNEEDLSTSSSCTPNKLKDSSSIRGVHDNDSTVLKADKGVSVVMVDRSNSTKDDNCERLKLSKDVSNSANPQSNKADMVTTAVSDCQPCSPLHLKLADKAREDSILEEARIIEVKRKRIMELSAHTLPSPILRKSHWDFVLEEMAWLANDFAQERLWKTTAAAQLCHQASFTSRLRFEKQNKNLEMKILSHTMAKAVMQFWHSVELLLDKDVPDHNCIGVSVEHDKVDSNEASRDKRKNSEKETSNNYLEGQNPSKHLALKVHSYALRYLRDSRLHGMSSQAEAPATPDKISDSGTVDMSWEEHLTEESLFYTVPPTAMETYRKSIESYFLLCEKTGSSIQEEVETSIYDTAADFGCEEVAYEEDDGDTSTYYLPGTYEGRSSKSVQKKQKNRMKSYPHRSGEIGTDLPYAHYSTGAHPSILFGNRPANLNVGTIPTRRVRSFNSRQRVVNPFAAVSGTVQALVKVDTASSGDTNSFQDDQSTLHGGSQFQKSMEVESVGDFDKQLPYDCGETSVKTKKKKPKNLNSAYDQGWQLDSVVLSEQRDHSKKRLDSHHFESNGNSGLYGQHNVKKLKMTKQSLETFDNVSPINNSIPSPAASQMSNMSNPSNKLIKIITGRDKGRKAKPLKNSAGGQPGSGSPWTLFEDQALVVLVHDMGPNWELVSDAVNSTLHFKCIFRKPKECKERHKVLMDKSTGDGADSGEDSGSSQPYPSTLPGIPKGSARQLFQRLQGPVEEDTLKIHFDKIIKIGQRQLYHRNQVILSDANVPGEGEHKIMSYVRLQRNLKGYDPNTRHCLYGLDADLIMLGLATHEIHFSILREVVFTPGQDKCFLCGQMGHMAAECEGKAKRKMGDEKGDAIVAKLPFQFLNIWTLREYLEYEMRISNSPFEIDFECILDDFIFICFFVGNDFLPHMPTLEIREGAINSLVTIYKNEFTKLGGYLTNGSKPNLSRVEHFIQAVGSHEDEIFQKRARLHQRQVETIKRRKRQARGDDVGPQVQPESLAAISQFHGSRLASALMPSPFQQSGHNKEVLEKPSKVSRLSSGATVAAAIVEAENSLEIDVQGNEDELKAKLKRILVDKSDVFNSKGGHEDKIKLGEPGWKERYYEEKFSAKTPEELDAIRKDVVLKYVEGLCWVMHYYYEGVCSWQWFYPYHYAPFASDLKGLSELNINFELGAPFKPFDQLIGVFPAASSHALPEPYRKLMTDSSSPIIDFYPIDFEVDMNGKRFAWQGIAKLPFIDETRLLAAVQKIENFLTPEEKRRNAIMFNMLFVNSCHPLSACISTLDSKCRNTSNCERANVKEKINPIESGGMNGYISFCDGEPCPPFFRSPVAGMEDIIDNHVICAIYRLPDAHEHINRPLHGVKFPKKTVAIEDLKPEPVMWHEDSGRRYGESQRKKPSGTYSSRQLKEAPHRLVVNSLHVKMDANRYHHPMNGSTMPYAAPINHRQSWPRNNYESHRGYSYESRLGYAAMPPPLSIPPQLVPYNAVPTAQYGYNQPFWPPVMHTHHHRSNSHAYERNSHYVSQGYPST